MIFLLTPIEVLEYPINNIKTKSMYIKSTHKIMGALDVIAINVLPE